MSSAKASALTGLLRWCDLAAGDQIADPMQFGDVVLWRKDAPASYHLAATVDDAADGISHVVRGKDLPKFALEHPDMVPHLAFQPGRFYVYEARPAVTHPPLSKVLGEPFPSTSYQIQHPH